VKINKLSISTDVQLFFENGMRYLKLQIAILFLLAGSSVLLKASATGGGGFSGFAFGPNSAYDEEIPYKGRRERHTGTYQDSQQETKDTKEAKDAKFFNVDQRSVNTYFVQAPTWESKLKEQFGIALLNGVLPPMLELGLKLGLPWAIKWYEEWSDPEGYEEKQAAEEARAKARQQLMILEQKEQQKLKRTVTTGQQLAAQETNAKVAQTYMSMMNQLPETHEKLQSMVAIYQKEIEELKGSMHQFIEKNPTLSPDEQAKVRLFFERKAGQLWKKINGLHKSYDEIVAAVIMGTDMRRPGKFEALGLEMVDQKQSAQQQKDEAKQVGDTQKAKKKKLSPLEEAHKWVSKKLEIEDEKLKKIASRESKKTKLKKSKKSESKNDNVLPPQASVMEEEEDVAG